MNNLERHRKDLDRLLSRGMDLHNAMVVQTLPARKDELGLSEQEMKKLPSFTFEYQAWYSEALAMVSQLLPDRVDDFVSYYKPLRPRKEITFANYTISDCLQGLELTRTGSKIASPASAIPAFQQQLRIVDAINRRFDSSLFDVRAIVQADLFDEELDAAAN
jgi:hypothetical protein